MIQKELSEFSSSDVECPTCGRDDFDSEKGMKYHHAIQHDESLGGEEYICEHCGDPFRRYPSNANPKYCSEDCSIATRAGKGHPLYNSTEVFCEECGNSLERCKSEREGKKWYFCNEDCRVEYFRGPSNPQYKGGHTFYVAVRRGLSEKSWPTIAKSFKESHSGGCEMCGSTHLLAVHHIIPVLCGGYHGESNYLQLCSSCHGGVEQYTKELPFVKTLENYALSKQQRNAKRGGRRNPRR